MLSVAAFAALVGALCIYTYLYSWWRERAGVAVVALVISAIVFVVPVALGHLTDVITDKSVAFDWFENAALAFGLGSALWSIYALISVKIRSKHDRKEKAARPV